MTTGALMTRDTLLKYDQAAVGETERTDFGLADARGRRIGYIVTFYRRTYSKSEHPWGIIPNRLAQPGSVVYRAATSVTRDGRCFGAAMRDIECASLEEAKAEAMRRLDEARKRYAKSCTLVEG